MSSRLARLALIGTLAGAFSGLFGVGGGTIIVPLLVLWLGYDAREAAATSLAAIVAIGALGAGAHGLYGNVDALAALLIGVPAVGGTLAGVALQQRVPADVVSIVFAVVLVASAVVLVV